MNKDDKDAFLYTAGTIVLITTFTMIILSIVYLITH